MFELLIMNSFFVYMKNRHIKSTDIRYLGIEKEDLISIYHGTEHCRGASNITLIDNFLEIWLFRRRETRYLIVGAVDSFGDTFSDGVPRTFAPYSFCISSYFAR